MDFSAMISATNPGCQDLTQVECIGVADESGAAERACHYLPNRRTDARRIDRQKAMIKKGNDRQKKSSAK